MESQYECSHYLRKCDIQAPCCKIWSHCRHCHNEKYKGPKGPGCLVETMDRRALNKIRCLDCQTEQEPSPSCTNCKISFARYYCDICKFWDDKPDKEIFHCEKCGICRTGTTSIVTHCDTCGACYMNEVFAKHKCKEGIYDSDCPVCLENLFNSIKPAAPLERCGHPIHYDCLRSLYKKSDRPRCPICRKMLFEETEEYLKAVQEQIDNTKDNLPVELKDKKVNIMCCECLAKTSGPFHFFGLKCSNCGSFNTDIIE